MWVVHNKARTIITLLGNVWFWRGSTEFRLNRVRRRGRNYTKKCYSCVPHEPIATLSRRPVPNRLIRAITVSNRRTKIFVVSIPASEENYKHSTNPYSTVPQFSLFQLFFFFFIFISNFNVIKLHGVLRWIRFFPPLNFKKSCYIVKNVIKFHVKMQPNRKRRHRFALKKKKKEKEKEKT